MNYIGHSSGGRKSKPTATKIAEGNPGKRKLNTHEPQPTRGIPDKPAMMGVAASEEWDRIAPKLLQLGLLTVLDGSALAAYCANYERWSQAEAKIQADGIIIEGRFGPIENPAVKIARESMALLHRFLLEFGLTPSSRSRLIATPDDSKKTDDESLAKPKPILRIAEGGQG